MSAFSQADGRRSAAQEYHTAVHTIAGVGSAPSRKPFLKRRGMSLRWRMRPVPVVFLRIAFWPHWSAQPPQLPRRVSKTGSLHF